LGPLTAGSAWAGHDDYHGNGHGQSTKHGRENRATVVRHGGDTNVNVRVDIHIGEPQRVVIHDYYVNEIRVGHCPPGLAKKHNGCLPPGQAKKRWAIGRPLPREVIFYELPPPLVVQLGPPPGGYRYVRVANDVLLITLGSGMVVDAIADLGRM
jgi:Ni/Co efflux regulator RcnB